MKYMGWSYSDLRECPEDTLIAIVEIAEEAARAADRS